MAHKDGTARICDLNAKPLRAVGVWLRDYQALWALSLRSLKRYIEETPNRMMPNRIVKDQKERNS